MEKKINTFALGLQSLPSSHACRYDAATGTPRDLASSALVELVVQFQFSSPKMLTFYRHHLQTELGHHFLLDTAQTQLGLMHSEKLRMITGLALPSVTERWVGWLRGKAVPSLLLPLLQTNTLERPHIIWLLWPLWPHFLPLAPNLLSSSYTGLCCSDVARYALTLLPLQWPPLLPR